MAIDKEIVWGAVNYTKPELANEQYTEIVGEEYKIGKPSIVKENKYNA